MKEDIVNTQEVFEDLDPETLLYILDNIPMDITFVDKNDQVRYFNMPLGKQHTFPRTELDLDRKVQNCHPPKSVHIVQKILEDFRNKKRKSADFWINFQDKLLYIRYFPVYDKNGDYYGVIEAVQDIKNIQNIKGEKRLLDEE
jgi:DUF438 domain-containing protein